MAFARKLGWDRPLNQAAAAAFLVGLLVYFIQFADAYFDANRQIALGWFCFAGLFILYKLEITKRQPWRLIFILLSCFLALRYIMWRAFDTLIYTGPLDFLGMSLLFLAEVYAIIIHFLGMLLNVWPLESKPVPLPKETALLPTVDIFIPTYNEPDEIIRTTAVAATQLDYPKEKLRVYLLDDGGTNAKRNHPKSGLTAWERQYHLRGMAEELGIGYITRETNRHAKAGNINHALKYTDGDLVLILDCDHVPTRDFLQYTVGHFIADEKLFLVQTPHFFINPTPVEKNLAGVANPSGENDMFYRAIHPALNFWNASYFCGSAAILRRKYLEEVGGISGSTITEDAETAFQLHARGYNSIYINRPMVCGLSPESYDDYVIQRSRWAQGMVQLVLLNNPLQTKGLSLPQRIFYFNSSFFWFFGISRFIYYVAPASFLMLGLNIYNASWLQITGFAIPYVVSTFIVMDFFYAGTRQPFFSEIYESVQSMFLIPAVISVLLNPRKPSFKVTPKGLMNDKDFLSPLSAPFFLVILINLAALTIATIKWFTDPILRDVILVTATWCIYNLYLALVSLGAFWERKQVRKFHRINASGPVTVRFPRMNASLKAEMRDVSLTGIGFELELPFPLKEQERVVLEVKDSYGREYEFECKIQRAIKRGPRHFCGAEFMMDLVSYPSIVSFVFGDSQRWVENWEQKSSSRGTLRMLRHFLWMGIMGVKDSAFSLLRQALWSLWKLAVKWFTTSALRDLALGVASWSVYHLYLGLVSLIEMLERKQMRKFHRINASGTITAHFPRVNATLTGQISDVSLTGIGVILELPFELKEQEVVLMEAKDHHGRDYRFDCLIRRAIKRDGRYLCGAEFNVDMATYPQIVRFVYGDSVQMLRHILTPASAALASK